MKDLILVMAGLMLKNGRVIDDGEKTTVIIPISDSLSIGDVLYSMNKLEGLELFNLDLHDGLVQLSYDNSIGFDNRYMSAIVTNESSEKNDLLIRKMIYYVIDERVKSYRLDTLKIKSSNDGIIIRCNDGGIIAKLNKVSKEESTKVRKFLTNDLISISYLTKESLILQVKYYTVKNHELFKDIDSLINDKKFMEAKNLITKLVKQYI